MCLHTVVELESKLKTTYEICDSYNSSHMALNGLSYNDFVGFNMHLINEIFVVLDFQTDRFTQNS